MLQQKTHPSPQELTAFGLGQLPSDAASAVESHISECQTCCETMLALSADDTFVDLLQGARRLPAIAVEPGQEGAAGKSAADAGIPAPLASHPRYEIISLLGSGGMGAVYQARHRMMERTVALKIINHSLVQKPEVVDRFHREVKMAARLNHPNIVTSHDAEQAGDVHFLVMEHVDGVDLSQLVRERGPLPIAEACDYIRQAAIGLQYAHERGMVHRDIKPHNLMVTRDGTLKILDFGLASLARDPRIETGDAETPSELTSVGAVMGTPDFISPEQADDARQADIRSDIYSLGATLYFLLTGRPPFAGGSVAQKLKNHAADEPEPLVSIRDDIPGELAAVVSRMTAKNPCDRFQEPAEIADALAPFAVHAELPSRPGTLPEPRMNRSRSRSWRSMALAVLPVVTMLAAAVYYIQTDHGTVKIQVSDPELEVTINGQTIKMNDGQRPLTIDAGKQVLSVRYGDSGLEFDTTAFQIRRNDQVVFEVELLPGEIVVRKDGARFDAKALPAAPAKQQAAATGSSGRVILEMDPVLTQGRPGELDTVALQTQLIETLSFAAGIPNAQWERFATNPNASTQAIDGEPLSLILMQLDPSKTAKETPSALDEFRYLTDGLPKPAVLAGAMSLSSSHGYVSLIQPDYIKAVSLTAKDGIVQGSVRFEKPGLYVGQVRFELESVVPRLQVGRFELPEYGISIRRDAEGTWHRETAGSVKQRDTNPPPSEQDGKTPEEEKQEAGLNRPLPKDQPMTWKSLGLDSVPDGYAPDELRLIEALHKSRGGWIVGGKLSRNGQDESFEAEMRVDGEFKTALALERFPGWKIALEWPRSEPVFSLNYTLMTLPEADGLKLLMFRQFAVKKAYPPQATRELFEGAWDPQSRTITWKLKAQPNLTGLVVDGLAENENTGGAREANDAGPTRSFQMFVGENGDLAVTDPRTAGEAPGLQIEFQAKARFGEPYVEKELNLTMLPNGYRMFFASRSEVFVVDATGDIVAGAHIEKVGTDGKLIFGQITVQKGRPASDRSQPGYFVIDTSTEAVLKGLELGPWLQMLKQSGVSEPRLLSPDSVGPRY